MFLDVILRSKATKNLIVSMAAEILRGACPEPVEGLRMTLGSLGMDPSDLTDSTDSTGQQDICKEKLWRKIQKKNIKSPK